MPAHRKDITGQRFGRLVAVEDVGRDKRGRRLWRFLCDCGNDITLRVADVTTSAWKSCGCLKKEALAEQHEAGRTHGCTGSRLYNIWRGMKKRCYLPTAHEYENYGGRNICVCDEWRNSFEAFQEWALSNGYQDHLTIDRKDNDGNYEPGNCRWATYYEQIHNRRKKVASS